MMQLSGFEITDTITETDHRAVYRARRNKDDLSVVLKVCKNSGISPKLLQRFKQAQKTTNILATNSVVKNTDLQQIGNHIVLVNEDFGNIPLRQWMSKKDISIEDKTRASIRIAETIGHIHSLRLIHQNINTESIEINQHTLDVKLTDFEYSAFSNDEDNKNYTMDQSTSDLHYISPEQTGKIMWERDYRTDYYSYGIVLYELFTSQLPFQTSDVMEMIDFHLAKTATPPNMINTNLPSAISNIIMKLLSKSADDRYQGYIAIRNDLQKCLDSLQRGVGIPTFQLALNDVADQFHLGRKLYGRDKQQQQLLDILKKSAHGDIQKTMILLSGASGTGKSSLINQAKKVIDDKYGFLIQGKFDQYQQGTPYVAFQKAFDQLAAQLILESEEYLARLNKRVKSTIGSSIQAIVDLVPSLSVIFGKQQSLAAVDPQKAKNRLNQAVQGFIKCIASQEHPLVLVLDDMQWVDDASLDLLSTIVARNNHKSFLIILSYRDNEVDDTHALSKKIHEYKKRNLSIENIELKALTLDDVRHMVVDCLKRDSKDIHELAHWAIENTDGNPFYVRLFLQDAYRKGDLSFDPVSEKWGHKLDKGNNRKAIDVVDFMASILKLLPDTTKDLLKLIALSGGSITLDMLSLLNKTSYNDVETSIKPAVSNGLVLKYGNMIRISHDRIQQAVNAPLSHQEKIDLHLDIARNLYTGLNTKQREEKLFTIAYHYNLARKKIVDNNELIELLKLNIESARKSYASGAYKNAFNHAKIAKSLHRSLSEGHSIFSHQVDYEYAKSAYLNGEYSQALEVTAPLLKRAINLEEKIPAFSLLKDINMSYGSDLDEVVATGIEILKKASIEIPLNQNIQIDYMNQLQNALSGSLNIANTQEILNLAKMEDENTLLIMKLCMDVCEATYYTGNIYLMKIIILKMIEMSLKHGNSAESAFAYSMYGMTLSIDEDYEQAYKFGYLATQLIEKLGDKYFLPKINNILCLYTNIYKRPIASSISLYKDNIKCCKENGDFLYGVWAAYSLIWSGLISGRDLREIYILSTTNYEFVKETNDQKMIKAYRLMRSTIRALLGDSDNVILLADEEINFADLAVKWKTDGFLPGPTWYAILRCQIFALTGEFKQGVQVIREYAEHLSPMIVLFPITQYYFYYGLCLAGLSKPSTETDSLDQVDYAEFKECREKLKKWSITCPENFLAQFILLDAEHSRITGNSWQAAERYKQAAIEAKKGYLHNVEALVHETASRFWLSSDYKTFAKSCIEQAINSYFRWGAMGKVQHIKFKYRKLLGLAKSVTPKIANITQQKNTPNKIGSIDMLAVIRASQAISSEISLDNMINNLMHTIIVNADAEKAILIREHNNSWEVAADSSTNTSATQKNPLYPMSIESYHQLPISVVHHVIRYGESIVLNNACESGDFTSDPYIQSQQIRSVACIPLHSKNRLNSIVYLENNQATFTFTEGPLEILRILLSQAVISLEHSILYDQLKNEIRSREEAENRATLLLNSTGEAIYGIDQQGVCIFANPACLNKLGYDNVSELLGKNIFELNLFTKSDLPSSTQNKILQTINTGNIIYSDDEFLWRKNGEKFSAEYWAHPIIENGKIKGVVVTFNDITERKNIAIELQKHRQHLEELVAVRTSELGEQAQIINQIQDSVFSMDLAGNIKSWNRGAEKQFGYHYEQVVDKHISHLYPGIENEQLIKEMLSSAIILGKYEAELLLNSIEGDIRYTHLSLSILKNDANEPRGIAAYSIDITDRKKSLALLSQRTAELTTVNQELESFSYSVSHDLRAPLRAIDGFSIALIEDCTDILSEQAKDYLQRVRSGAQQMGELIDDLLRLSRITRRELKRENINLSHVVESVIKKINSMHPEQSISYTITAKMYCNADPGLLRVALENLLENAWKYSRNVGDPHIEFSREMQNNSEVYYVRDNGIGFDMRYADKLFGAFQRLHSATEFEGNGIGLATAQRVIHLHGGEIWAKSALHKGATFFFTLQSDKHLKNWTKNERFTHLSTDSMPTFNKA